MADEEKKTDEVGQQQPSAAQAKESQDAADKGARTGAPSQNDSDPIEAQTLETGFDAGAEDATHVVTIHKDEGGPRGFQTEANGFVQGAPGQSIPVTLTDAEIKNLKRFKHLAIKDSPALKAAEKREAKRAAAKNK